MTDPCATSELSVDWVEHHLGRTPRVVFDIGAYSGGDAVRFKRRCPEARVVAAEACPENYANLVQCEPLIETRHLAICGHTGHIDFLSVHDNVDGTRGVSGSILGLALKHIGHFRPRLIYLEISETNRYVGAVKADETACILEALGYQREQLLAHDALYRLR